MGAALRADVLVLNKSWLPINIVTGFDAVCKVYQDKARIVDGDYAVYDFEQWVLNWDDATTLAALTDDRLLTGVGFVIPVPEVIVLNQFNGYLTRRAKLCRAAVFTRDDYTCQYCANKFPAKLLNIDHVLPRSRGGKTTWSNVVLSCIPCNSAKGCRTPEEAGLPLIRQPFEPHWTQVKRSGKVGAMPKSWEDFLGRMYWNTTLEQ